MLLKKNVEYNKMAKSIDGIYTLLKQLKIEFKAMNIDIDYKLQLSFLACISRTEILDKIDKYKWSCKSPIVVPSISKKNIVLEEAIQNSVDEILIFSEEFGYEYYIQKILNKEIEFYFIENELPKSLRNMLNL